MGRKAVFKWNLVFSILLIIVNIINGIVLVPLYLKYVDAAAYGIWLASGNILAWVSLIDPGIGGVLLQQVGLAFGRKDLKETGDLVGAGLVLSIGITILFGVVGYIFFANLPVLLDINEGYYRESKLAIAFLYALIGTMLMIGSYGITAVLQALQSSIGVGMLLTLNMIASLAVVLVLLEAGLGIKAIGLSILFRGLIQFIGALTLLTVKLKSTGIGTSLNKSSFSRILSLSSFNFLGKTAGTLHGQVQLFLIARFVGPLEVTIYKFTQAGPELSKLFLIRPIQAFIPSFVNLLGEKGTEAAKSILIRMLNYFVWIIGFILIGSMLLNELFVSVWVGIGFYAGATLNLLICLAVAISVLLDVLSQIVFAMGDVKRNNVIQFVQLIFFLIAAYWGVTEYGLKGLVGAYLLSHIVSLCYYPRKLIKMVNLTYRDLRYVVSDLAVIAVLVFASYVLFRFSGEGFIDLVFQGALVCVGYVTCLSFVSRTFRGEVALSLRRFSLKVDKPVN